jgi:hypothetical protein
VIRRFLNIPPFFRNQGETQGRFFINSMSFTGYIIQIYRFKKNNPRALVGLVEEIGTKGKKAFTNYDELWEILSSPASLHSSLQEKGRSERRFLTRTAG